MCALQKTPAVLFSRLTARGWAADLQLELSSSRNTKLVALNSQAARQRGLLSLFPQRVRVRAVLRRHGPPLLTPSVCGRSDSPCIHGRSHKGHEFQTGWRHRLALAI